MPWTETDVMDQRQNFVLQSLQANADFGALCREFGISRKTGYKWKERFLADGLAGLHDQSRRPKRSPNEISEAMMCEAVRVKLAHRDWGARKVLTVLAKTMPGVELPSESSLKRIFDRAGLVEHRRRRRPESQGARLQTPIRAERPNQVWTIDFKGWWYTLDRRRFEPLTIRDDYSRYVLCAQALPNARTETVQTQMSRVFDRYGLPEVIRSDNGSPFAAKNSPLGLSRLSAWWLTLGVNLDRIAPGRPDQNGGHERMHRDMAIGVERRPAADIVAQQAELDVWRRTFNEERPHEALGLRVPADVYERSPRRFDSSPIELDYPSGYDVRKVNQRGVISIHRHSVGITEALCGYDVGLESIDAHRYAVWFCRVPLGEVDVALEKFTHAIPIKPSAAAARNSPNPQE